MPGYRCHPVSCYRPNYHNYYSCNAFTQMRAALHGRSNHLGLVEGRMHRTACTHGLNLLVTYSEGCRANGAYSGLAWHREETRDYADRNFIRVDWPAVRFDKIIARVKTAMTENGSSACAFP